MKFFPLYTLLCLLCVPGLSLGGEKTVYGLNEYAELAGIDLQVAAKLDTGAKTASLSARDIKRFKRDGESWVRFYLAIDDAHSHPIERPLARVSKIKRRSGDYDPQADKNYTSRPVIALEICMGKALRTIEVNLTDRSAFQYPLLIGSEALKRFDALVDPSLKYAAGKPACVANAQTAE
ncbi:MULTISPECIES: ATP-dependent zinc protease family protein [Pseudomonas]|jgi:hypothetical protein|uniref:ATP-dependent zinc protease n=1 Tax=Pseudomonas versuta TaxID=1788301 RepID=A0A0M4REH9_9PSED|nr:ATP-dependent zinc protease [Pseudomonas versuta]ALE87221.1 ATP-dependent zinc protease [Pseudomonas versuta]OKA24392.1 ATP-dependent zinc protease [Pseudomonas versuta]OKA28238.1 ATP-dependent zinc protease [Pseudomonas versuta]